MKCAVMLVPPEIRNSDVVQNASVLFSVVPFSHNCGTKINLISINKAKSYQYLQRLKSVSVNDLAIDIFW